MQTGAYISPALLSGGPLCVLNDKSSGFPRYSNSVMAESNTIRLGIARVVVKSSRSNEVHLRQGNDLEVRRASGMENRVSTCSYLIQWK